MTSNKLWRQKNPLKAKAHWTVQNALRFNKLSKQLCEKCGSNKVQAHHDDYSKPLEVRWLCAIHHKEVHHPLKKARPKSTKPKGWHKPNLGKFKPNPLVGLAKALREGGYSYGKISKQVGFSRSQVYKWINDLHD